MNFDHWLLLFELMVKIKILWGATIRGAKLYTFIHRHMLRIPVGYFYFKLYYIQNICVYKNNTVDWFFCSSVQIQIIESVLIIIRWC